MTSQNHQIASFYPHLALLLAVTVMGLSFVGVRVIMMDNDGPLTLSALRYGLGAILLLPFIPWSRMPQLTLKIVAFIVFLGIIQFGLFQIFVNTALQDIPASRGAVIFALMPILTMLIAAIAGRDTLTGLKFLAALLSFTGVALAIGEKALVEEIAEISWTGEVLFLLAVCCGATYNAFSPRLLQNRSLPLVTVIGMAAGSIAVLPFALSEDIPMVIRSYDTNDWFWFFYLAVAASAFSIVLFNWGLKKLSPSKASIYVPIMPIAAAAFGALILDEHLSSLFLLGLTCAVAGPALMSFQRN